MCGIAGFTPIQQDHNQSFGIIRRMLMALAHRGPDDRGVFADHAVVLGHVRLSIIDIETGQQPMCDDEGRFWIVFNGEVFNYLELRDELRLKGHRFRTKSDTEVLLHLYKEYGPAGLSKVNGQFAFAIWDTRERQLFLARDRMGIRPLYYSHRGSHFVFASEIKALLQCPGVNPVLSHSSLYQIFTFWTTLTPNTAFEDIYELPPGHFMMVRDQSATVQPYWQLEFPDSCGESALSLEESVEAFSALINDAVRIRLRADVPVGAYLSGGIDSSVTTAIIKEVVPDMLRTFSIGFSDREFDESAYQRMVIDHLQTDNASISCSAEDIASVFSEVVRHAEIPLLRTAPAPMYVLSSLVHRHGFKVVITGEGADEMLAGYNIFKEMRIRRFWSADPGSRLRPLLLKRLYPYLGQISGMNSNALKLFFGYRLGDTDHPLYSHLLRWHNTARIRSLLHGEIRESLTGYDPVDDLVQRLPSGFEDWSGLSKAQWLESTVFMSNYLLSSQGDRMAMAHSVEGRYPFLDHRIIEFCARIQPEHKLHGLEEKYLLKQAMTDKVPSPVLRRPKQAYRAPVRSALLSGDGAYLQDLLSEASISARGLFDTGRVQRLLSSIRSGRAMSETDNMALTAVVSTHLLHELFADGYATKEIEASAFPIRCTGLYSHMTERV